MYPQETKKSDVPIYPEFELPPNVPPPYASFQTSFASISLHASDRIRLLQFPVSEVSGIRDVIRRHWPQGIQKEQMYAESYEFKLHGYPWVGQGGDAIPSRIVMRELLAYLFTQGWILHATSDVSKNEADKDMIMFRKQQSPPPSSEWIAISFNINDRMRLIGAPQDLIAAVRGLLQQMGLLQSEQWKEQKYNAWEFKINGYPWIATGEATMSTRLLLLRMLEVLETKGWSLYASIDQSITSSDTETWFCVKDMNWVPGSAVFHR
ncbi:hypothetical protein B7494_g5551 [Chlorociboria aeruginascens]|nr:hypothetical protein B7494_g5551 [Chlorociboria aeruginascens]